MPWGKLVAFSSLWEEKGEFEPKYNSTFLKNLDSSAPRSGKCSCNKCLGVLRREGNFSLVMTIRLEEKGGQ